MEVTINHDYIQFKNDILKDIREFEKKINEQIKTKNNSVDSSLLELEDKITKLEKDTKNSSLNIIEIKSKLNPLNEFFNFKQKIENMAFNHDIKIKLSTEEIERIKTRYDKILDDNLNIPGIIGGNCKFKNLKDYIHTNNNEIAKIKYGLEEEKKMTLEFKKKFEVLPKSMINMVDSAVRRSNEYTELKQKDIEKNIEIQLKDYNDKILEIKVEYLENKKFFEETINNLKNEINSYTNIKNEIFTIIDEKIDKINIKEKDENNKLETIKKDLEEIKKTKNKYENQVLNNTQIINEIKYKLKNINNKLNKNYKL
jgi:hypothetical protein